MTADTATCASCWPRLIERKQLLRNPGRRSETDAPRIGGEHQHRLPEAIVNGLVAGDCNAPNALSLPFHLPLLHPKTEIRRTRHRKGWRRRFTYVPYYHLFKHLRAFLCGFWFQLVSNPGSPGVVSLLSRQAICQQRGQAGCIHSASRRTRRPCGVSRLAWQTGPGGLETSRRHRR